MAESSNARAETPMPDVVDASEGIELAKRRAQKRFGADATAWLHWTPSGGLVRRIGAWPDRVMGQGATWAEAFAAAVVAAADRAADGDKTPGPGGKGAA